VASDLGVLDSLVLSLSNSEGTLMERSSTHAKDLPGSVTTPAPEKASVWEDFLDIFYAPSSVFARRANGSFFIPMLVVTLVLGTLFLVNSRVTESIIDAEMQRRTAAAMAKDPRITPEKMAPMRTVLRTAAKVSGLIGVPLLMFVTGLMLFLVGKLFGATQTFRAALVVAAYAYVPKILEAVLAAIQGFFVDPAQLDGRFRLTIGLGRFLDPDTASPALIELLGRIDLFTIWVTVLLVIGLAVTGRISRGKAAMAGVVMWVIGALPGVIGGLMA
jgi:hypothetical protein